MPNGSNNWDERELFERGPVVVFRWKNQDGWPVANVSPNAAEVFGYTPEQFLNGEVVYSTLIHPDDVERVGREVAEDMNFMSANNQLKFQKYLLHPSSPAPNNGFK